MNLDSNESVYLAYRERETYWEEKLPVEILGVFTDLQNLLDLEDDIDTHVFLKMENVRYTQLPKPNIRYIPLF